MLLEQLSLHNFGIYRGRHVIDLLPLKHNKPIILFGALNGSGKTTLLDALQLVLYGKFAQCSNRRELAYDEFLRRCIHRGSDPHDGAALELKFQHRSGGVDHQYRVHRLWTVPGKTVKERLEVFVDGRLDSVLTDQWADFVEDLIPVRLSKFFFFDGEQIEALADLDKSAEVLAAAIKSLLGLDLVDQLLVDLKVVERRNREKQKPAAEQAALEVARLEVERLEEQANGIRTQRAGQLNRVERLKKELRGHEEQFRIAGGETHAKREQIEASRRELVSNIAEVEKQLMEQADRTAPLLLVRNLLDDMFAGANASGSADASLVQLLEDRDDQTLSVAVQSGAAIKVQKALRDFLARDLAARKKATGATSSGIPLDAPTLADLRMLRSSGLAETETRLSVLLREEERLRNKLAAVDRKLASVPAAESLAALDEAVTETRHELAKAQGALEHMDTELHRMESERERKWSAYARRSESDIEAQHIQEDAARVVSQSASLGEVMRKFKQAAAERHVRRIEALIVEGLKSLLRKESLVSRLHIDSQTYRITLFDRHEQPLQADRLSAGERQLLAIATIWGLARAAGRPLPVVIDTPLGRLDSVHRNYLVERYFPAASHQVLLLSTDEEIDAAQYEKLRPHIGRSYTLRFHEAVDGTVVAAGYDFQAA